MTEICSVFTGPYLLICDECMKDLRNLMTSASILKVKKEHCDICTKWRENLENG